MIHNRGRVDHGRGAETGFVREDAARDSLGQSYLDAPAGKGARKRHGIGKRILDGVADRQRDGRSVRSDNDNAADDVEDRHERDEIGGDVGDPLQSAHDDKSGKYGHDDSRVEVRNTEAHVEAFCRGVRLDRAADAEGGQEREEGEEPRKPLLMCALVEDVHGAAAPVAAFVLLTEPDGEHDFAHLCRHAEYGRNQHPEECAGAAEVQGRRYAGDITGSDRRRESGGESREGRNRSLAFLLLAEISENFLEHETEIPNLRKAENKRKVHARTDEKRQHPGSPDDAVHDAVNFHKLIH